jgi:hypothetical protein
METQKVIINGRARNTIEKHGILHVREGYDIPINELEKFEKKAHMLGYNKSQMIAKLVRGFNASTGCGEEVKEAGSLFEYRAAEHIKEGVRRALKDVMLWNEN